MESITEKSPLAEKDQPIEASESLELKADREYIVSEKDSTEAKDETITKNEDGTAEVSVTSSDSINVGEATENESSDDDDIVEEKDPRLGQLEGINTNISTEISADEKESFQDEIETECIRIVDKEETSKPNTGEELKEAPSAKQVAITETLKQIISDIDSNIEKDEIHNENAETHNEITEIHNGNTENLKGYAEPCKDTVAAATVDPVDLDIATTKDTGSVSIHREGSENGNVKINNEEIEKELTGEDKMLHPSNRKEPYVQEKITTNSEQKAFEQEEEKSDEISIGIKIQQIEEEKIAKLKMKEMELLRKHEELNFQIQQQQILAEKLRQENAKIRLVLKNQEEFMDHKYLNKENTIHSFPNREGYSTTNSYNTNMDQKISSFSKEAPNTIDLNKIFTPATDYDLDLPRSRKLFASSAFYSSQLHPTMEDQLELARKISNSLSDTTNESSKGQSMYVNRKKRSVKWIHEGAFEESDRDDEKEVDGDKKEGLTKSLLQLVMNPRGQIVDYKSASDSFNTETGLFSPDKCAEVTIALQMQKGKGAELFAKRRKKVEKWIKDHYNVTSQNTSGILDQPQPYEHLSQPMDDNLQTFEATENNSANISEKRSNNQQSYDIHMGENPVNFVSKQSSLLNQQSKKYLQDRSDKLFEVIEEEINPTVHSSSYEPSYLVNTPSKPLTNISQRELAYLPSIPKGWNAPSFSLPKELFVPKEIPLECYAPPPTGYPRTMKPVRINDYNEVTATIVRPSCFQQKSYSSLGSSSPTQSFSSSKPAIIFDVENCQVVGKSSDKFASSYSKPFLGQSTQSDTYLKKTALTDCNFNNSARGWSSPNFNVKSSLFSGINQQQEILPYTDF